MRVEFSLTICRSACPPFSLMKFLLKSSTGDPCQHGTVISTFLVGMGLSGVHLPVPQQSDPLIDFQTDLSPPILSSH